MKVLILAAGIGTRISRHLSGNPKCMLDIGKTTLISYTLQLLKNSGIKKIGIILGYKHQIIKKEIMPYDVEIFYNPFFDVTNSLASAWFARKFIDEPEEIIIMNGDVFMEEEVLNAILKETLDPVIFADSSRREEADYKLGYENNILKKYGKDLMGDDITGEYIGVAKIGKRFIPAFLASLDHLIEEQKHSVWWENALYELSNTKNIYVRDIVGGFWAEVDYIEDYERILAFRKTEQLCNYSV
ncbi:L-glutamine-phosphate cytidylyltransferase [Gammaproteobacteria bacterium]